MITIVSPHFDDAVGSCGGMIASAAGKDTVQIITVFTQHPQYPLSEFAVHLHDMWNVEDAVSIRTQENVQACQVLHANALSLGFTEAIYRIHNGKHLYPKEGDIFTEIADCDFSLSQKIADAINAFSNDHDTIYLPAGIGGHVDHLLVAMCRPYLNKNCQVRFYQDFSYEGTPYYQNLTRYELCFCEEHFIQKKNAVQCYKSQLEMLFDEHGGLDSYYEMANRKSTKLYAEAYYR